MDRGLLIGINHYVFVRPLSGCLNDVAAIRSFLIGRCGFSPTAVEVMPEEKATRAGILNALERLAEQIVSGDRVVLHFSGHGSQLPTLDSAHEADGLDEIICPINFRPEVGNGVRDRDFRRIFGKLPPGVRFVWISDSCSSGDLAFKVRINLDIRRVPPPPETAKLIEEARQHGHRPLTFLGAAKQLNLALLSACGSNATAHETTADGLTRGLFTYLLLVRLSAPDGFRTPLRQIIGDVARQARSVNQFPEVEGADANVQAPFPGVTNVDTPFGGSALLLRSASFRHQEDSMSDSAKKLLCRADYEGKRLSTNLAVVVATGTHPSEGYSEDFEPVQGDVDTFRFVHVAPSAETGTEEPFTKTLTLIDFSSDVVHIQDATGEVDVVITAQESAEAPRNLNVTDPIGRGVKGKAKSKLDVAAAVDAQPDCDGCVIAVIEQWADATITNKNTTLADLYEPAHGSCDEDAMTDLIDRLNARGCGQQLPNGALQCADTVKFVIGSIC